MCSYIEEGEWVDAFDQLLIIEKFRFGGIICGIN